MAIEFNGYEKHEVHAKYAPVVLPSALLCSGDTLWSDLVMRLFVHAMNLNADRVLWL